jgi:hypothetical protein
MLPRADRRRSPDYATHASAAVAFEHPVCLTIAAAFNGRPLGTEGALWAAEVLRGLSELCSRRMAASLSFIEQ